MQTPATADYSLTLLFLIFMTLKLCHVISWSWWLVTAPLWGLFALLFAFFGVALVIAAFKATVG